MNVRCGGDDDDDDVPAYTYRTILRINNDIRVLKVIIGRRVYIYKARGVF